MWHVYILECSDRSLYTGISTDVAARVRVHNEGKGAKYTSGRLPVNLIWHKEYADRSEASQAEWQLKQLSRQEKLELIEN